MGNHGDADIGLQQLDQVALRGDLVAAIDRNAMLAERSAQPIRMFAVISRQPLLGAEIIEADCVALRQRMPPVDDEIEILGEQRPGVEPIPIAAEFCGDAEFGLTLLQILADLVGVAAQESKFEPVELAFDLVEIRNQDRHVDGMAERDPQRSDFAAFEGCRQHARAAGGVIALLQQRVHPNPEFGQLRRRPLPPEQIAAHFRLELLDRPRQRRLGDVAFVGGAREVQQAAPRRGNT